MRIYFLRNHKFDKDYYDEYIETKDLILFVLIGSVFGLIVYFIGTSEGYTIKLSMFYGGIIIWLILSVVFSIESKKSI